MDVQIQSAPKALDDGHASRPPVADPVSARAVAARLLNFARPGQIVISAATRYATEGAFVFGDLGGAGVDGRADPVRAYAVTREIGVREDDYLRDLVEA